MNTPPEASTLERAERGPCWFTGPPPCRAHALYPPPSAPGEFTVRCDSEWDPHVAVVRHLPAGNEAAA